MYDIKPKAFQLLLSAINFTVNHYSIYLIIRNYHGMVESGERVNCSSRNALTWLHAYKYCQVIPTH